MATAKYSRTDTKGKLYVDCSECERGGNGSDKDKCSCGWQIKRGRQGGRVPARSRRIRFPAG